MKCDDCINFLEPYVDGEVSEPQAEQISAHLIACANCSSEFEALSAEREIYARYDRELEISPALWQGIAARTFGENGKRPSSGFNLATWFRGLVFAPSFGSALAGAMAVLIVGLIVGFAYLRRSVPTNGGGTVAKTEKVERVASPKPAATDESVKPPAPLDVKGPKVERTSTPTKLPKSFEPKPNNSRVSDSGVLFTDVAYQQDFDDRDVADHVERAQNLLRSVRNLKVADDAEEVDVSYEKAASRRLLNENIVLRRDAETNGKFPTKTLLGDLEPFLIDIANLPDKTTPDDLRAIQDRMQRTEIVAALRSY
jgi:hypothetical protein